MPPYRAAFFLRSFPRKAGRRIAPYKRFGLWPKPLMPGEFISPEQMKWIWGPRGALAPWGTRKKYGLKAARRAPQFSKR